MRPTAVFLRAINVSGRRLLMDDFRRALAEAGYDGARTVAAAGNAVVMAPAAGAALEAQLEAALARALGAAIEVFVRDGSQLAVLLAANPFADFAAAEPGRMVAVLTRGDPTPEDVAALQARIHGPERVAAGAGCLYAAYPDGQGVSKLTPVMIERALGLRGTARNWNTMRRMAELTASA